MRHKVKGRKLKRTHSHRLATLRAIATSLLRHKRIKTTLAKAKEARTFVEPLITKAKNDSVHSRRYVASQIKDKSIVKELFSDIVTKIGNRPGGYTRIVKLGRRKGDAAELAFLELVDYGEINLEKAKNRQTEKTEKAEQNKQEKKDDTKVENKKEELIEEANVVEETVQESSQASSVNTEKGSTKNSTAKKGSKKKKD
ncbi:50S ribosomal protein L17 [Melioribacteraceae bacterium 4301-Me]|uniref:50S ribosomal protein L17 n=1 Tax=Pyranulibacter aquaticus TaxID=3163344 RepID=UPI0035989A57